MHNRGQGGPCRSQRLGQDNAYRAITGEMTPDTGNVTIPKGLKIGRGAGSLAPRTA
ncbi:MAG: hypothetical protein R3D29_12715 [Nitratireductor sp.]